MNDDIMFLIQFALSFLPFIAFAFLNTKANTKKELRYRQYLMPLFALVYSLVLLIFLSKLSNLFVGLVLKIADFFEQLNLAVVGEFIRDLYMSWGVFFELVVFNTFAIIAYVFIKRILTAIFSKIKVNRNTFVGSVVEVFYNYEESDEQWYIKEHYGQARTFIKTVYYCSCFASAVALMISCSLCMKHLISAPFYPIFAVIMIGELAFFIDGIRASEKKSDLTVKTDNSRHIALYPLVRKPLKELSGVTCY